MRFFDCTTYFDEELMMDVRFNLLDKFVEKFIVVESIYSHSGVKKKLNFKINNYSKFKDKIVYLVIENEPEGILELKNDKTDSAIKRINSLKRIEQSYNFMFKGIQDANDEDIILLSDNDEIPNLKKLSSNFSKQKILIFEQLLFYYKFNLYYDYIPWYGTKGCKKKKLKSFSWLRNLKNKSYPFWRIDTYFSDLKSTNVEIIKNGGWHFTNIKTPEQIYEKLNNYGHHNEFESSGVTLDNIKDHIKKKVVTYNHKADQSKQDKYNFEYKLKKVDEALLPDYLIENRDKLNKWFD